uniref:HIG1 domain-containing protein n=1 Tax=Globodera rostochiensis TaxID=31243 RepID=A0A914GSY4_GLORO
MTQQQHFRLFSTQRPTNFDGNETDPQTHFVVPKASSNTVDPFGWEPTKWDRFYLVLTRCYARSNDIPAVIPSRIGPMFTKRMRVLRFGTALVAAIIVCFGLEFYMLGWDKHMRRGKLSKDELKFIDKMATRSTTHFQAVKYMAAWHCLVTRCGALLSSGGAMAAATAVAPSRNNTDEEFVTEDEHTPVGDASLPPPPKRPLLQLEKKRFDPANPASPSFRHIGAIKDAPEKRSLGFSSIPLVPIGMGATVLALLYMFRASLKGNQNALMMSMQYRMIAQFLTIISLLVGTVFLARKESKVQTEPEAEGRKEI